MDYGKGKKSIKRKGKQIEGKKQRSLRKRERKKKIKVRSWKKRYTEEQMPFGIC